MSCFKTARTKLVVSGSTAAFPGAVLTGDANQNLYIVDGLSGDLITSVQMTYGSLTANPVYVQCTAIFGEGNTGANSALHAYNVSSGVDLWAPGFQLGGSVDTTPVIIGTTMYVVTSSGYMYVIDISDLSSPATVTFVNVMSITGTATVTSMIPSTDGNAIFVGTQQGLYC